MVSFNETVPQKMYEVAPSAWMIHEDAVWFSPVFARCKIEKAVEEGGKPVPKKDFKQYSCKVLYETGGPLLVVTRLEFTLNDLELFQIPLTMRSML